MLNLFHNYSYIIKLFFLITISLVINSCAKKEEADLIINNGIIYTLATSKQVESIAIKDGIIFDLGNDYEINKYIGKNTEIINLDGSTLIPGFIEGHGHLMGIGYNLIDLDLLKTKSYDEIIELVKNKANNLPKGTWIIGRGWHQDKWKEKPEKMINNFPVHDNLSVEVPNHPVYLRHASGHASLANKKAMEIFNISNNTNSPEGGEIFKDLSGNPTGIFNETAQRLIQVPNKTKDERIQALILANNHCLENGITSFHNAGSGFKDIEVFKELANDNKLDIRLYTMLDGKNDSLLSTYFKSGPKIGLFDNKLTIRSIKLYSDGALGSRGAWLIDDYNDEEGTFGHVVTPLKELERVTREGFDNGFQICTHAIGDRANREVLNIYESVLKNTKVDHRFRIEHAQHIDLNDIPRFQELNVIASIQGIHLSSDRPWAIKRLGKQRIVNSAYPWRKLINSGAMIINGTDAPVERLNPIESFYASVTRKTLEGHPEYGYESEEKMTRIEALKTYTINAAFGAFEEKLKGTIEKGKFADFTVINQDILTVEEEKILDTKIIMTIIGGNIKYKNNQIIK